MNYLEDSERLACLTSVYKQTLDGDGNVPREFAADLFALMGEIAVDGAIEIERDCPFHKFLLQRFTSSKIWHFIHYREPKAEQENTAWLHGVLANFVGRPKSELIANAIRMLSAPQGFRCFRIGVGIPSRTDEQMYRGISSNVSQYMRDLWREEDRSNYLFDPAWFGRSKVPMAPTEVITPAGVIDLDTDKPVVVGVDKQGKFKPVESTAGDVGLVAIGPYSLVDDKGNHVGMSRPLGATPEESPAAISIPFGKLPDNLYIRPPQHRATFVDEKGDPNPIKFRVFEKSGGEAEDLRDLNAQLLADDDIKQYEDDQGVTLKHEPCGFTTIDVLQDLWGMPYNNLILAYIIALRPSKIQIGNYQTCDGCTHRVHVSLSADKKTVTKIRQEVRVGYGTGYDIGVAKKCLKEGRALPEKGTSGAIGHTAGLERVDFK